MGVSVCVFLPLTVVKLPLSILKTVRFWHTLYINDVLAHMPTWPDHLNMMQYFYWQDAHRAYCTQADEIWRKRVADHRKSRPTVVYPPHKFHLYQWRGGCETLC